MVPTKNILKWHIVKWNMNLFHEDPREEVNMIFSMRI